MLKKIKYLSFKIHQNLLKIDLHAILSPKLNSKISFLKKKVERIGQK